MAAPLFKLNTGPKLTLGGLGTTQTSTPATTLKPKPTVAETLKSLPAATIQQAPPQAPAPKPLVNTIGNTANSTPFVGGGGIDPFAIAQGTARELGAVGQKTAEIVDKGLRLGIGESNIPKGLTYPTDSDGQRLYRAIYGTTEDISLQSVGEEYPGVSKGSKFAPIIAVGGFLTNAIPGGGEELKALKALTATKDTGEAFGILKKLGISEEVARHSAPIFAGLTDETEVKSVFKDLQQFNKTATKTGLTSAEDVTKALGTKERGFVTSVKEAYPELTKVAGQYVPRDTDTLAIKARNFIKESPAAAELLAKTGTNEDAVATAAEYVKKLAADAAASTDEAVRAALHDKAAEIANAAAENLTELGRSVQAASILGRLTPEGMARFAARTIQRYNEAASSRFLGGRIPELTGEQLGGILSKAKAITEMPDGVEKAIEWRKLMDDISTLVPTPMWKKLVTLWKAGLLTGLKTTMVNTLANLSHGVSEGLKDIPAAAVDKVASLFTGKRTLALTGRGAIGGVGEGFSKGWEFLKTGYDERNLLGKLDYQKISFGNNAFARGLQTYEETIFRVLGAEDQPFFYGAKARSLTSQAIAMAKNEGLKGAELAKKVDQLVANPTDQMLKYAMLDAETAVFQNKTALGNIARRIQNIPGAEFVLPFGRTPAAVATQIINYSPFGIVKTLFQNIGKGRFEQRLFAQGLGRGLTGTALYAAGYKLGEAGLVALDRPTSEGEQKLWEMEGKKQGYIKIDGVWRSPAVLGPAGNVLVVGAYFQDAYKKSGSLWAGIAAAAFANLKTVKDQSFLTGVNQFLDALNDPQGVGPGFVNRTLGSAIPTIIGDVARGTDKYERRTGGGLTDQFKSRIPGVREKTLEPQLDTFGKPIETPGLITTLIDPTRPATSRIGDPVVAELRRLSDAHQPATPTQLGDKNGYSSLTPKQNTRLWQVTGVYLNSKLKGLFAAPQYQALDDEGKAKTVRNFTDQVKVEARAGMLLELTKDLEGTALLTELAKHKTSGLMSKEVYERYLELR